jgi:2,4-dienoyl-CoA reductase-like NADH-dependent reductase (Old Yellow Enzyme family)
VPSPVLSPFTLGSLTLRNRIVRAALGPDCPVLVKINTRDGMKGGLELEESTKVAAGFASAGATALVPSCGFTARTPLYMLRGKVPSWEFARTQQGLMTKVGMALFGWSLVRRYPFTPCFLKEEAAQIRDAVNIPVAYVGGVRSLVQMEALVAGGFAFMQLGRAIVRDPDFVVHLDAVSVTQSDCDQCNRCVASMSVNGIACARSEAEAAARR